MIFLNLFLCQNEEFVMSFVASFNNRIIDLNGQSMTALFYGIACMLVLFIHEIPIPLLCS